MGNISTFIAIILSALIIVLVLIQGRGAGLGSAWGGSGETFQTRRGVERWVMRLTVGLTFLFLLLSFVNLLI